MLKEYTSKQFYTFLLTGGLAAGINFFSRIVYSSWLTYSSAVILAYITGMLVAFILAKLFVFKESAQKIHHSALIFTAVNLFALIQTWAISLLFAFYILPFFGITDYVDEFAHLIGIMVPAFTSYIGHKRWSFR